jgi:hypothetical protein
VAASYCSGRNNDDVCRRVGRTALAVGCARSLMNVLDTTIVGVALLSIRQDLGFSPTSLAMLTCSPTADSCC